MALHRVYGMLKQLENDRQLQARIDAVEERVRRIFEAPARRSLAAGQHRPKAQELRRDDPTTPWRW